MRLCLSPLNSSGTPSRIKVPLVTDPFMLAGRNKNLGASFRTWKCKMQLSGSGRVHEPREVPSCHPRDAPSIRYSGHRTNSNTMGPEAVSSPGPAGGRLAMSLARRSSIGRSSPM